jgi:ADP-heptose:LPS heptosyltransferase
MQRFTDQALGQTPHIAVLSSSKIGNFVALTPLLRGLKEKYPTCTLDFFGSDLTAAFESHCPHINARFSLYSSRDDYLGALADFVSTRTEEAGPFDLAINCDEFSELNLVVTATLRPRYVAGAALDQDFRSKHPRGDGPVQSMLADDDWNSLAFLQRYRDILSSNYIGEIFCRLAYVETDYFRLELPTVDVDFQVPHILVHVTTTRRAKMWPMEYWQKVINWCEKHELSVGLVGSAPKLQRELYHGQDLESDLLGTTNMVDLRGRTSLIELAGAMKRARACISVDAGPLHVAAAVDCPTVAVFGNHADGDGASPLNLWAPRMDHVRLVRSTHKCTLCADNRFKNESCLVDDHPCMRHLQPEAVIETLQELLNWEMKRALGE